MSHPFPSKLIALAALGSCFELFDFLSFIFLSPLLAKVFFPSQTSGQALLYTFIIFSTGYFFRPIGGLLLAHFGDRYGRKGIFILTLILMSLSSLVIAFMPNPQKLGLAAPLLLALMRMTQGISLGGEVAGSATYIAEFTSREWRTFACSLISSAANIGVILAALMVDFLNAQLNSAELYSFGWRLPFLIGAALGLLTLYLRKNFLETPLFLDLKNKKELEKIPLLHIVTHYRYQVLMGFCLALMVSNSTATFHLFFPTYLSSFLNYSSKTLLFISASGIAILAVFSPLFALTSRYIGRKNQALIGTFCLFILCSTAIISGYGLRNLKEIYALVLLTSLAIALINSVLMAMLADLFPTQARFTGVALAYNLGCLAGAGFTPALNTYLINTTGYLNTPFTLVTACGLIATIVFVFYSKEAVV
jgi:MHS family proline/betaine transporter-like MFS transporter